MLFRVVRTHGDVGCKKPDFNGDGGRAGEASLNVVCPMLATALVTALCASSSVLARRLLHNQLPPSAVNARTLVHSLPMDADSVSRALVALEGRAPLRTERAVLSPAQCKALIRWARPRIDGRTLDSVDGEPECQVTVDVCALRTLLGNETVGRLCALGVSDDRKPRPYSAFVRKYSPTTRRVLLPFHVDTNAYTLNLALTADADVRGGRLLALHEGRVRELPRAAGDAVLHDRHVCHAVTAVREGTRFSLVLFFYDEVRRSRGADGTQRRSARPAATARHRLPAQPPSKRPKRLRAASSPVGKATRRRAGGAPTAGNSDASRGRR